jgi:lipopolysaccharide transport system permease protein
MKKKEKNNWDLIIEPQRGLLDVDIRQIIRYKDLLFILVKRDITVTYKQTILGPLWFFLQPIMTTVIFVFIFGRVANLSTDNIPQPLFYLSGIVIWNYFSECFMKTSDTFTQNAGIFGKVYFPRLISPLSVVMSNAVKFLIQFSLFIALYIYYLTSKEYALHPRIELLFLPLYIVLMSMLGLGLGLVFSSLTTKYKDLKFLIQFGVQLLMYATPIIYPLSTISAKNQIYFKLNPITHIIEGFKYSFFGTGYFSMRGLLYSFVSISVILCLGILIFNKTEKDFMDTV